MNFLEILLHTMNWIHVYLSSPFYSDNGLIKSPKYCVTFPWIFKDYFCLSGCHFFIHHCSEVAITFYSLLCSLLFLQKLDRILDFSMTKREWCLKGDQKKKHNRRNFQAQLRKLIVTCFSNKLGSFRKKCHANEQWWTQEVIRTTGSWEQKWNDDMRLYLGE